jgi:hypothetical protein
MDRFLFSGGVIFIMLALLSFWNRDALWRLYSLDRGWQQRNPERTPEWDQRTRRYGFFHLAVGIAFMILSIILV